VIFVATTKRIELYGDIFKIYFYIFQISIRALQFSCTLASRRIEESDRRGLLRVMFGGSQLIIEPQGRK
jgi:hypothetical protein